MKIKLSILIFLLPYIIVAQNEVDALRYSFIRHGGTARYNAMSGAFGALGSDFSSLSTNPAGIATFKKSVKFMISPGITTTTSTANYRNKQIEDENITFALSNIGLVIEMNPYELTDIGWQNICFGIGYNRFLDLNEKTTIKGYSEVSSMLDQFVMNSNGSTPKNLFNNYKEIEWLAWAAELTDIKEGSTDNTWDHQYLYKTYLNQKKIYTNKGGVGEMVFTIGGNYANKLQVGATLGIHIVRFINKSEYTESSDSTDLAYYTFTENLHTSGAGFNIKLGMIYTPVRFLRLGFAFHSPTFYQLKDVYSYSMESHWRTADKDGNTSYVADTKKFNDNGTTENEFTYELYSPLRLVASTAFVISRFGILSADYEYINYSKSRLRAAEGNFTDQNNNIKRLYNEAHNLRLGAEIRLAPLYLRGGVAYYGSPYSMTYGAKGSVKSYSLGIGLKAKKFYLDFAYSHSEFAKDYKMFDYIKFLPNNKTELATEVAELTYSQNLINLTIGFRF